MRKLVLAMAAALVGVRPGAAAAQKEVQWWHAMGGHSRVVNELADDFNASQTEYKVVPVFKGTYAETMTAGIAAYRASSSPAHRPGLRGRHRDDDGRQGGGEAGLPADGGCRRDIRSQGLSAGGLRLLHHARRQDAVAAVQQLDPVVYWNKDIFQKAGLDPDKPPKTWPENVRDRQEARAAGRAVRLHASSGRPGPRSRISAPGTTCPSPPRRTGSAARMPSSNSTTRCASGTSTTWPSGRRTRASTMAAREGKPTAKFTAGECGMHPRLLGLGRRHQGGAKDEAFGIAHAALLARCRRRAAELDHRRRELVGDERQEPKDEYKGVAKFFTYLSSTEVQAKWHQQTGYLPITKAAYRGDQDARASTRRTPAARCRSSS